MKEVTDNQFYELIMKEKIIHSLLDRRQPAENLCDGLRGQAVFEYDFPYLAEEIIKLFSDYLINSERYESK